MVNHSLISAGALIYCRSTKRYLFVLRDECAYSGTWGLPGGKIKADEGVLDGLYRECKEELGNNIPPFEKIIPIEKFTSDNQRFAYHTFLICVESEFIPTLNHEHRGYCWVRLEDHPKPLHPGVWQTFNFDVIKNKLATTEFIL